MKGDFTRQTFHKEKHYTTVLKQQGRVAMDSDWNEQEAIHAYYREAEGTDIIGQSGAPVGSPGFAIRIEKDIFFIGVGRYYVDGILCENEGFSGKPLSYEQQPDLPAPDSLVNIVTQAPQPLLLIYLDVWQRHITALDDPAIREKALGGPDTATRLHTVWQVKAVAITIDVQVVLTILEDAETELKQILATITDNPTLTQSIQATIDQIDKIVQAGTPTAWNAVQQLVSSFNNIVSQVTNLAANARSTSAPQVALLTLEVEMQARYEQFLQGIFDQPFPEWLAVQRMPTGLLSARTQPTPATDTPCQLPPSAGYQSLENQLYRIEILQGGDTTTDTISYLWSRDNGTVVTTITNTDPLKVGDKIIIVDDLGPDDDLGFARTQLVEITDDILELHGLPGQLTTIADINRATHSVTLTDPLAIAIDVTQHAKLRRWDGTGSITPVQTDRESEWLTLERNIQIKFSSGTYKTGDYWLIPARAIDGSIEWPVQPQDPQQPLALSPQGIQHHYAPLAMLTWQNRELVTHREAIRPEFSFFASAPASFDKEAVPGGFFTLVHDYRTFFQPLTAERPALHVLGTNWDNDAVLTGEQFLRFFRQDGLIIYLDDAPDPQSLINGASIIVSVEIAQTDITVARFNSVTILMGTVDVVANAIRWQLSQAAVTARPVAEEAPSLMHAAAAVSNFPVYRIRVQLKGNLIWGVRNNQSPTHKVTPSPWRYLDGQALGFPGGTVTLPGGTTRPQTRQLFPSGTGNQTSDFESWFWVDVNTQQ